MGIVLVIEKNINDGCHLQDHDCLIENTIKRVMIQLSDMSLMYDKRKQTDILCNIVIAIAINCVCKCSNITIMIAVLLIKKSVI